MVPTILLLFLIMQLVWAKNIVVSIPAQLPSMDANMKKAHAALLAVKLATS